MVQGTWEDVHRLYANNIPLQGTLRDTLRDWSILTFWRPWGSPGNNPLRIPRDNCTCVCVHNKTTLGYFYRDNNCKSSLRKSTH